MSISKRNIVTHGLSGMLGDLLVFRQKGTKTVVAVAPIKGRNTEPSEAQQKVRDRFKSAATFARAVSKDPQLKKAYGELATPDQSAANLAFADYFRAPEIIATGTDNYKGKVGDIINPSVVDTLEPESVFVQILRADKSVLEEGPAVMNEDKLHWDYTAKQQLDVLTNATITITAKDRPGNISTKEITLA